MGVEQTCLMLSTAGLLGYSSMLGGIASLEHLTSYRRVVFNGEPLFSVDGVVSSGPRLGGKGWLMRIRAHSTGVTMVATAFPGTLGVYGKLDRTLYRVRKMFYPLRWSIGYSCNVLNINVYVDSTE